MLPTPLGRLAPLRFIPIAAVMSLMWLQAAIAQPPSRGDGRGDGPPGGGFSGRGDGPPGGRFSGRGDGPPGGGFSGRGDGPPGGGFSGRGFGGPGGDRPGDGGPVRIFGGRDGDSGGRSEGSRGGIDPSGFLSRMDRNGNGMLDMDEREGPAGFMISRLQREDPSIRTDRPIPMSKLSEGFERMRGGGGDRDGDRDRDRGRGDDSSDRGEEFEVEALVPGFGVDELFVPVPGFGPTAVLFDVEITPDDLQEAEERLRRYDRNRDGLLSKEELGSRWEGNPLDFDRNRDGKLTASELAVRYARQRSVEEENRDARWREYGDRRAEDQEQDADAESPDPYGGRKSFRTLPPEAVEGLPEWFASSDADHDGQVMMNEYTTDWSNEKVEEFFGFDINRDGTITVQECLVAVQEGATRSGPSTGSSRYTAASSSASPRSSPSAAVAGAATSDPGAPLDNVNLSYAQRILNRNDANQDGALTVTEWQEMLMDPSPADANRDGRITVEEYAGWLQTRSNRLSR